MCGSIGHGWICVWKHWPWIDIRVEALAMDRYLCGSHNSNGVVNVWKALDPEESVPCVSPGGHRRVTYRKVIQWLL